MKILVVVSGLALVVPVSMTPDHMLTALFARDGMHRIGLRRQATGAPVSLLTSTQGAAIDLKFSVAAGSNTNPIDLGSFVSLADLAPGAKLRSDCLGGKCAEAGRELVQGRVRFSGEWSARAVSRCQKTWNLPVQFSDKVEMDFRRLSDLSTPNSMFKASPKATAIALETTVKDLADLTVFLDEGAGPKKLKLAEAGPTVCRAWTGSADPCVVVEVENWFSMKESAECKKDPSLAKCRVDEHFGAFYDFLEAGSRPAPAERWLPYVAKYENLTCAGGPVGGPGHFPAKRCPMAVVK